MKYRKFRREGDKIIYSCLDCPHRNFEKSEYGTHLVCEKIKLKIAPFTKVSRSYPFSNVKWTMAIPVWCPLYKITPREVRRLYDDKYVFNDNRLKDRFNNDN